MIYHDELGIEIEHLKDIIDGYGNAELTHREKELLSDQLAEVTYMIRVKYGLTSAYYVQSELRAQKKIGELDKAGTAAERVAKGERMTYPDPLEDLKAEWLTNITYEYMSGRKSVRCSKCRFTVDDVLIGPEFCPNCKRRMRSV